MTLEQFNKKYKHQSDEERFNTSLDIWELSKDEDIIRANLRIFQGLFFNYVMITNIINRVLNG